MADTIIGAVSGDASLTALQSNGWESSSSPKFSSLWTPPGSGGNGTSDGEVPAGADPAASKPITATAIFDNASKQDMRVVIQVPPQYSPSIIFPYTPQITLEHKAEYASQNPLHSNYTLHFYKGSQVADISIQGVFTVQNDQDAIRYLDTIKVLRKLTKGQMGDSQFKGSPPPVCRLRAYGNKMLNLLPVAIASFRQDLASDVDYYYLSGLASGDSAMVPTKVNITVLCKLMMSRTQMLTASLDLF